MIFDKILNFSKTKQELSLHNPATAFYSMVRLDQTFYWDRTQVITFDSSLPKHRLKWYD